MTEVGELRNKRRVARLCAAVLIHAAIGMSAPAGAEPPRPPAPAQGEDQRHDEAKEAFKAGKKALAANKLTEALDHFRKADALVAGAAPRFMQGQIYEKLGKPAEAVAAYQSFIDLKPDPESTYGKKLPEAHARIAALSGGLPARLEVKVIPAGVPVAITVNNAPLGGNTLALTPGQHTVVVTSQGYQPHTETITVKGNERRNLVVTLQPVIGAPIETREPAVTKRRIGNIPAFVVLGAAGASAIVGGVFGGLALSEKAKFDDNPTGAGADRTERNALIADVSLGVAGGLAIIGTVLLFVIKSPAPKINAGTPRTPGDGGPTPALAPWALPAGAGTSARWLF